MTQAPALPGRVGWALLSLMVGGALCVAALTGLWSDVVTGVLLGCGAFVAGAELVGLVRARTTMAARALSLMFGLVAASVAVMLAEGRVEISLPALVAGGAVGAVVVASALYAEHVISVEGPHGGVAAMAARVYVPWRDLFGALVAPEVRKV